MLPYSRQTIDEKDIEEIIKVLKSDYLTTGPKIGEFEKKFANYVGSKYAVAVSSGTAALHIACLAAGLKNGEELVTTPLTFAADGNCALYCGAKPKFVDITKQGLIDSEKIEEQITDKTKILLPVDYAGFPCDLSRIKEISIDNNMIIIEDASHALGAEFKGNKIGSCRYVDMTIFSFHPVKHITTGEGGMITTNSDEFYTRLIMLRSHGITKDPNHLFNNEGPWYYEMQCLGFNYRLTDFQCALGISQLHKIDEFVKRRREIAEKYNEMLSNNPNFEVILEDKEQKSSYHLYPILLKKPNKRKLIFEKLRENGLWVQVHYIPIYFHPYYMQLGYKKGLCPKSENFYSSEISIPLYPSMNDNDVNFVIKTVKKQIM